MESEKQPIVASRAKRFWAFTIDQTIITLGVLVIFIAVFATQTQQMTTAFNTFFADPLWSRTDLPSDVFQSQLEQLMGSEKVKGTVEALAYPFALAVTLSLVFEALYYIAPTMKWGQTLGKKWVKIVVRTLDTDQLPDWLQSSIRYFAFLGLGTFSAIVMVLDLVVNKSFLPSNIAVDILGSILSQAVWIVTIVAVVMITTRIDRRGLHDIAAKTIVLNDPKKS